MKIRRNIPPALLLTVLPLVYLVFGLIFSLRHYTVYFDTPDPQYAYLVNGVNLASCHLEVGHVDHPGTPVQCFAAALIFIKHLFAGGILYQDVLLHPESYLRFIKFVLLLLLPAITYLTGRYAFKKSGSAPLAMVFQLVPLSRGGMEQAVRIAPEAFMILGGMFYMAFLYFQIVEPYATAKKTSIAPTILAGVFVGFLTACKFTCIPLVLIALFALPTRAKRLFYLITALFSFFLFILPAYSLWHHMFGWLGRLFLHDGRYGTGAPTIINPATFKSALVKMFFQVEWVFPIVCLIISLGLLAAVWLRIKNRNFPTIYFRTLAGIWLAGCVLIISVAKHYAFYYLLPFEICYPLALVVTERSLNYFTAYKKIRKPFLLILCGILIVAALPDHIDNLKVNKLANAERRTQNFIKQWQGCPIIIAGRGEDQPSALVQPSLVFGAVYAGNRLRIKYLSFLANKYPNCYEFNIVRNELTQCQNDEFSPDIFQKSRRILVYIPRETDSTETRVLSSLCTLPGGLPLGKYRRIYNEPQTGEDVFEITSDSALARSLMCNRLIISCNLESLSPDNKYFLASNGVNHFGNANLLYHDQRHSGHNSIKLDKDNPYGLTLKIGVTAGDYITTTVWNKGDIGSIVFSAGNNSLYRSGALILQDASKNGWRLLTQSCAIPNNFKGDSLLTYMYYDGDQTALYDDIAITITSSYPADSSKIPSPMPSHD